MPLTCFQVKEKLRFPVPVLIHLLSTCATISDLFKLRQINEAFYSHLNPIYLNLKQLTIEMKIPKPRLTCITGRTYCRKPNKRPIVLSSGSQISRNNWDPNIAYLFKHLIMENLWFIEQNFGVIANGIKTSQFISQICLHVTKLTLKKLPEELASFEEPNKTLSKFIQRFKNLRELCTSMPDEVSQLKILINHTNPTTKVIIDILDLEELEEILRKFGSSNKLKINLNITTELGTEMESLMKLTSKYSNVIENFEICCEISNDFDLEDLPITRKSLLLIHHNIKINVNIRVGSREEMELLEKIAALEYSNFIDTFEINLAIWSEGDGEENHISIIRKSLEKLSPFITKLELTQSLWEGDENFDWPHFHFYYPKLQKLEIEGGIQDLDFLQSCIGLEYLELRVFEESMDASQEFLEYYLKDMTKLKEIRITGLANEYKQKDKLLSRFISLLGESVKIVMW